MRKYPTFVLLNLSFALFSAEGATTAVDDFSSGNSSGGANWSNSWSGGTFANGAMTHSGNSPQQISRTVDTNAVDLTSEFSVCFELGIEVDETSGGQYGFRAFMSAADTTFQVTWKSDINGGNLTFSFNGGSVQVNSPGWNMANDLATIEASTYKFQFDMVPTLDSGQNYRGTYSATVTRDDGASVGTGGQVPWINDFAVPVSNFHTLTFLNSSNKTDVTIDNVQVGDPVPIPEISTSSLVLLGLLLLRRRR